MKALSFTQPYASLVIDGRKKIETRSWPTGFRGEIAIHAAKSIDADACVNFGYDPDTIVRGAIIGVATLTDCFRFTMFTGKELSDAELSYGRFHARALWLPARARAHLPTHTLPRQPRPVDHGIFPFQTAVEPRLPLIPSPACHATPFVRVSTATALMRPANRP